MFRKAFDEVVSAAMRIAKTIRQACGAFGGLLTLANQTNSID
jgi:hypothetical protein